MIGDDGKQNERSESREAFRISQLDETPRHYRPRFHLLAPTSFALVIIGLAIRSLDRLVWVEGLTIPVMLILSNAAEWRAHRDLLHKRSRLAPMLYEQHTPIHHRIYTSENMKILDRREWRLVLIPPYGIVLLLIALAPIGAALWFVGLHNVALLFIATGMFYVLAYEWLHLSYHLDPDRSWIARTRLIRFLGQHHATHHNPRLMQKWNLNVSIPLWDIVRGTCHSPERNLDGSRVTREPL